jgi:hypothetical protein
MSDLLEVGTEVGHEKPRKSRGLSNLSNLAYLRPGGACPITCVWLRLIWRTGQKGRTGPTGLTKF